MIKFGSKIAEKVLSYFFTNPHKKLHLQGIARILEVDPGNLCREIKRLRHQNIFEIEEIGNIKVYSLNQTHPLYNELKKIVDKTIGIEAKFRKSLEKFNAIKVAFIYGSFAKERQDQFSDIDLMIIGKPNDDDDDDDLIEKILVLQGKFDREINYTIFSPEGFAKGLKNKDVFLEDIMENPKIFIIGNQNELKKIIGK